MEKGRDDIIKFVKQYDKIQSLMRYINLNTLKSSYHKLMKGGDEGIGAEYGKNLDENLSNLLRRMKNFSYFPQPKNCASSNGNWKRKYAIRAFEDEIVQGVFKEILEAIYESKVKQRIADLKKIGSLKKSCNKVKVHVAWIEIDIEKFLVKCNQESLINFLEQDIADRNFIRYIRRFLQSGVALLRECTDSGLGSESIISFISMICKVCEYYMLQILDSDQEWGLNGEMCVQRKGASFRYLFDRINDARIVYRRLYRGLKRTGFNPTRDKICTLSTFFDDKKQYCKASSSRRSITRVSNLRRQFDPPKKKSTKTWQDVMCTVLSEKGIKNGNDEYFY